jgi:hypothetical protein
MLGLHFSGSSSTRQPKKGSNGPLLTGEVAIFEDVDVTPILQRRPDQQKDGAA